MGVTPEQQKAFFDAHAGEAQAVGLFFGFPISIMLAHSAAESSFGTNTVVDSAGKDHNVFFGLSGTPAIPCKRVVTVKSKELQFNNKAVSKPFCSYDDYIESAIGWCEFTARHPNGRNAMKNRDKPSIFLDFLSWYYRGPVNRGQHDQFVADIKKIAADHKLERFDTVSVATRLRLGIVYGLRLQTWVLTSPVPLQGPGLAAFAVPV